ncbi:hypothetical protein QTJ16_007079 [Diplocarpon rosae]|uniref:DUF2231 domain-containing protein n=1 Tax=Diplocarpon rosae TaxID=946125 RepID=A0AAD9SVP4_9HELO|nr:hypothetical protein QTJ16_007079 [Diplocarpon rosae]PBP21168.1 hypothetical protein BUE80_DR007986 [Diplocarpon rosae]
MPSILDLGTGKVGSNSHPLHPATVHLPIAFLLLASLLDMLAFTTLCSPLFVIHLTNALGPLFPTATPAAVTYHLSLFSYASTVLGTLTAFPAITSGVVELYTMVSARGLDLADPVVKTTLIHAGVNDVAVLGAVYNVVSKWKHVAFAPEAGNFLVSSGVLAGIGYAAFLGGGLVYEHGVGVQRMGRGKQEREQKQTLERSKAGKDL